VQAGADGAGRGPALEVVEHPGDERCQPDHGRSRLCGAGLPRPVATCGLRGVHRDPLAGASSRCVGGRRDVALHGVRIRLAAGRGPHLELDRRLTLVGDLVSHAGESGDGVEQPPAAGGERRVDAGVDLPLHDREFLVGKRELRACGAAAQQPRRALEPALAEQRVAPAERRAPRLLDGCRAARQRQLLEMSHAAIAEQITDEHLAAPEAPVVAVAQTVHADTDHGLFPAVLYEARGDVSVMMLHGDLLILRQREGVLGGQILGVQVVADHLRLEAEQLLVHRDAGFVVLQRLQVLQIADMLAEKGVGVAREAEGVLELGAAGERLREGPRQGHRERGVAP